MNLPQCLSASAFGAGGGAGLTGFGAIGSIIVMMYSPGDRVKFDM